MAKNRLAYGMVVVILLLLFIILGEHRMTYMAIYAALILPLLSLGLTMIFTRRFTISEELNSAYIIKGETARLKCILKNNSFLPCPYVQVNFAVYGAGLETDDTEKYVAIHPYKSQEIFFPIYAKYRGNYQAGISDILLYDFLGLFKFAQKYDRKIALTVNPRIVDIALAPLHSMVQDAALNKNHQADEDYNTIADLRKYQPTDGYKKIHWKASAKRNELISKNFQATEENAVVLLVDNSAIGLYHQAALEMEDAVVEALVAVVHYCVRLKYSVSVRYLGDEDANFYNNFDYLYQVAADLQFSQAGNFNDYLSKYLKVYSDSLNLVVFTPHINNGLFGALQMLRQRGNNIVVVYFVNNDSGNTHDKNIIQQLQELSVYCINFAEIQDIRE